MSSQQTESTQDITITTSATTEALPKAPETIQSTFMSLTPMLLIFVVFYFFLIRPQEKKRKEQAALIATVKPGEEVLLHSGIYGKVTKVNENDGTFTLQVSKDVEMKVLQSAIADIISRKAASPKAIQSKVSDNDKVTKKGKNSA